MPREEVIHLRSRGQLRSLSKHLCPAHIPSSDASLQAGQTPTCKHLPWSPAWWLSWATNVHMAHWMTGWRPEGLSSFPRMTQPIYQHLRSVTPRMGSPGDVCPTLAVSLHGDPSPGTHSGSWLGYSSFPIELPVWVPHLLSAVWYCLQLPTKPLVPEFVFLRVCFWEIPNGDNPVHFRFCGPSCCPCSLKKVTLSISFFASIT